MSGSLDVSYTPHYFSLMDILATQERVPCVSNATLPRIGFLDPGSDETDLGAGTKMDQPFWILDGMRVGKKYMSMQLPKAYKETYREIMLADPNVVNLHKLGPHYFEFGRCLMKHTPEEGEHIGDSISTAFKRRLLNMLDAAQNCRDGEEIREMSKMDELERELFKKAYAKRKEISSWVNRQHYQINTSSMVTNFKKRKAMQISS